MDYKRKPDGASDKRSAAMKEHKGSKPEYMVKNKGQQFDRRTGEKMHKASPWETNELPEDMVAGRNAVMEALKGNRSVNKILVANGSNEGSIKEIIALAKEKGVNIMYMERSKIDSMARGIRHQGVLAQVAPVQYVELEDILNIAREKKEPPFILLLDELEDPHNLGALLRTADAAGVHGVLIPKRRSVPLSATVAKTSAGAVEYVPVARIGNMVQTIRRLKDEGLWVAAADMDGTDYYEADMTGPLLLIVGSEGHGVGRLVKEQCDFVVRIPMMGKINSLNASVAGSILMYEAMKQRIQRG